MGSSCRPVFHFLSKNLPIFRPGNRKLISVELVGLSNLRTDALLHNTCSFLYNYCLNVMLLLIRTKVKRKNSYGVKAR